MPARITAACILEKPSPAQGRLGKRRELRTHKIKVHHHMQKIA
jgi:hypothetical protein